MQIKTSNYEKVYVNDKAQANGDHEVHHQDCVFLPSFVNRTYLGEFSSCKPAVAAARKKYRTADGCRTCSRECHSR